MSEIKTPQLAIPYEVADAITLATLMDCLDGIQAEVNSHIKKKTYMHPEDFHQAITEYIPSLKVLIKYYGGVSS
jgi:hypothetical protein